MRAGMSLLWGKIFLVSLTGGLIALDRSAAFQFMISRPIVAGPLIGLLLQQPAAGIVMGALLELIWISDHPLGGHLPPNECLAAIVCSAAVILVHAGTDEPPRSLIVLGFLFAPPIARIAAILERQMRRAFARLAERGTSAAATGRLTEITRLHFFGLTLNYLGNALYIFICLIPVCVIIGAVYPLLPSFFTTTLEGMFPLIILIGIASALSSINVKWKELSFGLCFAGILIFLIL